METQHLGVTDWDLHVQQVTKHTCRAQERRRFRGVTQIGQAMQRRCEGDAKPITTPMAIWAAKQVPDMIMSCAYHQIMWAHCMVHALHVKHQSHTDPVILPLHV